MISFCTCKFLRQRPHPGSIYLSAFIDRHLLFLDTSLSSRGFFYFFAIVWSPGAKTGFKKARPQCQANKVMPESRRQNPAVFTKVFSACKILEWLYNLMSPVNKEWQLFGAVQNRFTWVTCTVWTISWKACSQPLFQRSEFSGTSSKLRASHTGADLQFKLGLWIHSGPQLFLHSRQVTT